MTWWRRLLGLPESRRRCALETMRATKRKTASMRQHAVVELRLALAECRPPPCLQPVGDTDEQPFTKGRIRD